MTLRLPDSDAEVTADGRRHAPSAARNAEPILAVLQAELPAAGALLEIASGTGQHAALFAAALPGWRWQPSDVNAETFASIRAWAAQASGDVAEPQLLDVSKPGWGARQYDAILAVNLLHLIPVPAARAMFAGVKESLVPGGKALIYGPFLFDGQATSAGDAAFDASLRAQNPNIGYKDISWVQAELAALGLTSVVREMPANNRMLIIFKI